MKSGAGGSSATTSTTTGSPGTSTTGSGGSGVIGVPDAGRGDGAVNGGCDSSPSEDRDKDGYTVADGDCNDCDPFTNPGAFDVPGNMVDEDCSGTPDDEPTACDDGLPEDGDAVSAAKAIGICRTATADAKGKNRTWGLLSARYVFPNGSTASIPSSDLDGCKTKNGPPNDLSHGILKAFGTNVKPRQGASLAALSSGIARSGKQKLQGTADISPDGASMCTRSTTPDGFPVSSYTTCGDLADIGGSGRDAKTIFDGMALELAIRVPTNAKSFSFDFDFYTFEYTDFVCSEFNDAFVALLYSKSPDVPMNHNIAFDAQKNPVCVNNGFVEVCEPYMYMGTRAGMPFTRSFTCQYGTRELAGTGFDSSADDPYNHAATGWLQTHANIVPGEELTLRFAVWDAGDEVLDSTALIDNVVWDAMPGNNETIRPPPPK